MEQQTEALPIDIQMSPAVGKLFDALAKAQGEIKGAAKDATNPHFKSHYADLASISNACRPALAKHGIAVVQIPYTAGQDVGVMTMLGHSSGEWIRGSLSVRPMKFDAQGAGSVITYLRRYSLAAMAGVAPEDDDGEGAVGRGVATNGAAQIAPAEPRPLRPTASADAKRERFAKIKADIQKIDNADALDAYMDSVHSEIKTFPAEGYDALGKLYQTRRDAMLTA